MILEWLFNCCKTLTYCDNLKSRVPHKEIRWRIDTESISKVFVCHFHKKIQRKVSDFWHFLAILFFCVLVGPVWLAP